MQTLVEQVKQRNVQACKQLYMQYADAMYHVSYRMVQNQADAEDILQEAFMKVFNNIDSFKGESTIGAWIKQIVINHSLNFLRKKKIDFMEADGSLNVADEVYEEENIDGTVQQIKDAIATLPDGYRTVFNLYMFEDYSHRQIAELLNISESTAKTQLFKAKNKIRELVKRNADGRER